MWFYVGPAGQQLGPVSDAQLDELVRQGVVRDDTLVWREGQGAWQPHATLRGPSMAQAVPPPAYAPPAPYAPPPAYAPPPQQGYMPPPPAGGPVFDYAQWPTRVLGALIDYLLVAVAMGVLYFLGFVVFGSIIGLGSGVNSDGIAGLGTVGCCCMIGLMPVASLAVGVYNKAYLVSNRGFSIGQGVAKVKVVDAYGNKLTFGTAFLRLLVQAGLGLIAFAALADGLWPLWDERKQTLHDKAVSSYVINNPMGT